MKCFFTFIFVIIANIEFTQNLTGIWQGTICFKSYNINDPSLTTNTSPETKKVVKVWKTFSTKQKGDYKYEIQIEQTGNSIKAITYVYNGDEFYAKHSAIGSFDTASNRITISEDELLEMKRQKKVEFNYVTCSLNRIQTGNDFYLTGTFSTKTIPGNQTARETGTIVLKQTNKTDFNKENL